LRYKTEWSEFANECIGLIWMAAYRFIQHLRREKQAMEMTEYGKHGKP
jgi:hypothetical protein